MSYPLPIFSNCLHFAHGILKLSVSVCVCVCVCVCIYRFFFPEPFVKGWRHVSTSKCFSVFLLRKFLSVQLPKSQNLTPLRNYYLIHNLKSNAVMCPNKVLYCNAFLASDKFQISCCI